MSDIKAAFAQAITKAGTQHLSKQQRLVLFKTTAALYLAGDPRRVAAAEAVVNG